MRYQKQIYVCLFAVLTMATTCEGDDFEPYYPKNAHGIPEYKWLVTVSAESFQKNVIGEGWKWTRSSRITDEGQEERLFFQESNGYPADYFFTADSVTKFIYKQEGNTRQCATYVYDEKENLLTSPLIKYMQVCNLGPNSLTVVEYSETYGYCVTDYERMMPFELNARLLGSKLVEE